MRYTSPDAAAAFSRVGGLPTNDLMEYPATLVAPVLSLVLSAMSDLRAQAESSLSVMLAALIESTPILSKSASVEGMALLSLFRVGIASMMRLAFLAISALETRFPSARPPDHHDARVAVAAVFDDHVRLLAQDREDVDHCRSAFR